MNDHPSIKHLLAFMLCFITGVACAQSLEYNIELEKKEVFSEQEGLKGEVIPNNIILVPKAGYGSKNIDSVQLSGIFNNEFEIKKYKKNKLMVTGNDDEFGEIKYIFDLKNDTGKLRWEGGSLKFDAWGSWTCTNHTPNNHTCGKNKDKTLKQCSQEHKCIF